MFMLKNLVQGESFAMSKKKSLVSTVLILSVFGFCLMAGSAGAFCVYNNTDRPIHVKETYGCNNVKCAEWWGVQPGDHVCCNWKNKDCNMEGKRDSTVKFMIHDMKPQSFECLGFPAKAGGWVSVTGTEGNRHCEAFFEESSDK
jgi:hypothetical protein